MLGIPGPDCSAAYITSTTEAIMLSFFDISHTFKTCGFIVFMCTNYDFMVVLDKQNGNSKYGPTRKS